MLLVYLVHQQHTLPQLPAVDLSGAKWGIKVFALEVHPAYLLHRG